MRKASSSGRRKNTRKPCKPAIAQLHSIQNTSKVGLIGGEFSGHCNRIRRRSPLTIARSPVKSASFLLPPSRWANRSAVFWHLGQYQEAINSANKALYIAPNSVPAWFKRGVSLESLSQYEKARKSYQQVLRIAPKLTNVWVANGFYSPRYK